MGPCEGTLFSVPYQWCTRMAIRLPNPLNVLVNMVTLFTLCPGCTKWQAGLYLESADRERLLFWACTAEKWFLTASAGECSGETCDVGVLLRKEECRENRWQSHRTKPYSKHSKIDEYELHKQHSAQKGVQMLWVNWKWTEQIYLWGKVILSICTWSDLTGVLYGNYWWSRVIFTPWHHPCII